MSIDKKSPAFSAHSELARLPESLLGGSPAMRQQPDFLPQGSAESEKDYEYRLSITTLTDAYEKTLNYLTGQVFSSEPKLEDAGQALMSWSEDVDKRGNALHVWGAKAFSAGVNTGVTFCLVDYSKVQTREGVGGKEFFDEGTQTWRPRTVEAARMRGWAPYLVLIKSTDVIDAWVEVRDGKPVLTHFRYFETVTEEKGDWDQETIQQIRVLKPGMWETYRKQGDGQKKGEWTLHESGATSMPEIPVAVFMPGAKLTEMTARPALSGLAELCLRHWRASSGHELMMDWMRRPMIFGKCLSHEDGYALPAAPGRGIHSSSAEADIRAVNMIPPDAVATSAADIAALETAMGLYGLRVMAPKSSAVTAAQVRRESGESDSTLTRWAGEFEDFLERILQFVVQWMGGDVSTAPSVTVNKDYENFLDSVESTVLFAAVDKGILSRQMVFDELVRRGVVRTGQQWEDVAAQIENDRRASASVAQVPAQGLASALLGQRQAQGPATA